METKQNWSLRKIAIQVRKLFKGYNVKSHYGYHYLSGFIKIDETRYVYFSTWDERFKQGIQTDVLFRTATSQKDYSGGYNNYFNLEDESLTANGIIHKLYGVVN